MILAIVASIAVLVLATGAGSVFIPPADCAAIIAHRLFGIPLPISISAPADGIIWSLRLPRVLLAFAAGAALSVSGAVMQSVLKNPLASSFTLGVSSGASLGAAIVILGADAGLAWVAAISNLPFAVPAMGFLFALATIFLVMRFSRAADRALSNNTIILAGMVASLFVNAILTLLSAFSKESINRLVFWQMGSFALKGWAPLAIVVPVTAVGIAAIAFRSRELDIMTFSDDEATAIGVDVKKERSALIALASVLTGCTIAFTGVIGFIDLAVPHMVRRVAGPAHRLVIPFSALAGGILMALADLAARTLVSPLDLPVGAITAAIGAPFFAYVYLSSRKQSAWGDES
jgi:iron complex transport system permease protein